MKQFKFIALVMATLFFATNSQAQATASASASATIVTPISITKDVDMNFGNVAVQTLNAGTVILATDGSRLVTGGVTIPVSTGTVTAASFTVDGEGSYLYDITLPSSVTITDGTHNMTVDAFSSDPDTQGQLSSGTQTLNVGATLNVNAAQAAGAYTTATPFDVTVNYN
jgi:hypothetical protein